MSSSPNRIRATIGFVVFLLAIAHLESAAFGQNAEIKVRPRPSSAVLRAASTVPVRLNTMPAAPSAPPPKGKSKKLAVILAVVGAGVATAILAGAKPGGGSQSAPAQPPSIVLLPPTVVQPQ